MPEARFPLPMLLGVLEQAARVAGTPHLGLMLGARHHESALGVVGEMMARAATLGEALKDYVGMQLAYSRGATVYLQRVGGEYAIGYGVYDQQSAGSRQLYDLVVAVGCNLVRNLTGGAARPVRVLQCCRPPADPGYYTGVLKAPIAFDQEQTCIIISAADMALSLPRADAHERLRLREGLLRTLGPELGDLKARVRHALRPRLMIGEGSREAVTRDLGLNPRTLARQLAAAGTSFEAIKDEVRYAVARELLLLTELPVGRVGDALSYATHSAFDHAFRRWSGMSPSQWRVAQMAQD